VLASGIEATQSIYNNQLTVANNQLTISNNQLSVLNNRFAKLVAYLTLIGTVLLIPNTLATMLGNSVWVIGPNFLGAYAVLFIVATSTGTIVMWYWMKKSGLLNENKIPTKEDLLKSAK
jgi:magnesium transporter